MTKGKLSALPLNRHAQISSLGCKSAVRCRLIDLGMADGSSVECIMKSFGGGISAYKTTGGTVIAIRREDADLITIDKRCFNVQK